MKTNRKRKVKERLSSLTNIAKKRHGSSGEDDDDDNDDDFASYRVEEAEVADDKSGYRINNPCSTYHVNKRGLADDKSFESTAPTSIGL